MRPLHCRNTRIGTPRVAVLPFDQRAKNDDPNCEHDISRHGRDNVSCEECHDPAVHVALAKLWSPFWESEYIGYGLPALKERVSSAVGDVFEVPIRGVSQFMKTVGQASLG